MEQKQKATEAAPNTAAKVQRNSRYLSFNVGKLSAPTIILAIATTDPDPMDWNELDSFSNKPPTREREEATKSSIHQARSGQEIGAGDGQQTPRRHRQRTDKVHNCLPEI